ncbi:MAG: hypothetical protein WD556_11055 [Actinomycetota bacterium]
MFDRGMAVALQGTKVVLGGFAQIKPANDADFVIVRYRANGTLDASFAKNGRRVVDFAGRQDSLQDLIVLPNGTIVGIGTVHVAGDAAAFGLVRLTAGGALDLTFDGGVTTPFSLPYPDYFEDLAIQSNGRIVVGGWATVTAPDERFLVGRVLAA